MFSTPLTPTPDQDAAENAAPAAAHEDAARQKQDRDDYRRLLQGMMNIGADLLHVVHFQALAPDADPAATPGHAVAFERITRAVRRNIVLALSLDAPARPAKPPADRARDQRPISQWTDAELAEAIGPEECERLDRLDREQAEAEEAIADAARPTAAVLDAIARGLDVASKRGLDVPSKPGLDVAGAPSPPDASPPDASPRDAGEQTPPRTASPQPQPHPTAQPGPTAQPVPTAQPPAPTHHHPGAPTGPGSPRSPP